MIAEPRFRSYEITDRADCLRLFDENCPEFFAPNEREDYVAFLAHHSKDYVVASSKTRSLPHTDSILCLKTQLLSIGFCSHGHHKEKGWGLS
jgi:hypothetical protein